MHLTSPRIAPLEAHEWSPEQAELLRGKLRRSRRVKNIYKTLVRHPEARRAFSGWAKYILSPSNTLLPRDREILILRTAYLCRSGYEWTQHAAVARRLGLTEADFQQIKRGASAPDWSPRERILLCAADELHARQFVADQTWDEMRRHFEEKQCMDVVFTVGEYTQVAMFLNSFGVQLEPDQTLDDDLRAY